MHLMSIYPSHLPIVLVCLPIYPFLIYHRVRQGSDHENEGTELGVYIPGTEGWFEMRLVDFPFVTNMTCEVLALQ